MKVRLRNNTVRLRLDQKDIAELKSAGQVVMTTPFIQGKLTWTICGSDEQQSFAAVLQGQQVTIQVPNATLQQWISTEQVGIEGEVATEDEASLKLLIEKDFKCLTARDEDESNAFPNPLDSHQC
ncbi:DUF7009 family protein [Persicobacter psychrovividus]|uniref:PilZ domain-containing protein n=1 Tax=Persicobacter psychrovividus TaxID=387638 RepID=A0ABM7VHL3_9BACT|nr:hypothetical protein PEPS_27420 [Persicobacter psychrovividus]